VGLWRLESRWPRSGYLTHLIGREILGSQKAAFGSAWEVAECAAQSAQCKMAARVAASPARRCAPLVRGGTPRSVSVIASSRSAGRIQLLQGILEQLRRRAFFSNAAISKPVAKFASAALLNVFWSWSGHPVHIVGSVVIGRQASRDIPCFGREMSVRSRKTKKTGFDLEFESKGSLHVENSYFSGALLEDTGLR